ncbi:MAG: bifunctional indole-3-glycerol-phosphate synthase TrpC/phosphoribosylanthranilate isomerase TrpF [Gammaproteobacteria bacterium]|nr:bifunctional indole-3-glycerol-phosphate synthase TrpC/phosphoribosylanthranilate isomerase TrpF [Gammaproteobacteria bacterium]MBU1556723.1 bifunctional indole-3-glycerol-phosphate synthase TrpC/phosphoribosylanthranilate isomerase TrpF [Gammaproteobacteria bacterium]MBU2071622.1 bifunctional indole-3-glycerol-phosphate synthase TrpC/phosphoribosylanthranilate isomerase TrpF [Gammaproteobacteria bacterium]MBU2182878.1 bifunctional indole-3-glycerol-phosphate synthase TrpC/phosphoribosylanthr
MPNVLAKIVAHKRDEVAQLKQQQPLTSFISSVAPSQRDFLAALKQSGPRFILECKKASPSKGLIRAEFNLEELAQVYGQYADCISVLTDEKFFQGKYDYLRTMRSLVDKPLLHKDFIIDSYQIYLGRHCGADAVLLMLSVLDDEQYRSLAATAAELNMTVLTEVSNEAETLRAVALNAELIGINNRDLRDLSTNLDTSFKLAELIPAGRTVVSESGIYTNQQVRHLAKVADAFLVGSSLMAQADLAAATRKLVLGEHKVCGLTRPEDAAAAYAAGAYYGGLIFYPPSARYVTPEQAALVQHGAALHYVGVFVNANATEVAQLAHSLGLSAVQLHGEEDDSYISTLQPLLPAQCQIWKAYRVKDALPEFSPLADRILLDAYHPQQHGGSGISFNWSLLTQHNSSQPIMLAGGLNSDNCLAAAQMPVAGLDFNSGLENAPGIKDAAKIRSAFTLLREFHYE